MIAHLIEIHAVVVEVRNELAQVLHVLIVARKVSTLMHLDFLLLDGLSAHPLELPLLIVHLNLVLGHFIRALVLVCAHHLLVDLGLIASRVGRDTLNILLILAKNLWDVMHDLKARSGHPVLHILLVWAVFVDAILLLR